MSAILHPSYREVAPFADLIAYPDGWALTVNGVYRGREAKVSVGDVLGAINTRSWHLAGSVYQGREILTPFVYLSTVRL